MKLTGALEYLMLSRWYANTAFKQDFMGILKDGLYQVTTSYLCAGFIVVQGQIRWCAPILRKKLAYWKTVAVLIFDGD